MPIISDLKLVEGPSLYDYGQTHKVCSAVSAFGRSPDIGDIEQFVKNGP
jgi:hypothetical protein